MQEKLDRIAAEIGAERRKREDLAEVRREAAEEIVASMKREEQLNALMGMIPRMGMLKELFPEMFMVEQVSSDTAVSHDPTPVSERAPVDLRRDLPGKFGPTAMGAKGPVHAQRLSGERVQHDEEGRLSAPQYNTPVAAGVDRTEAMLNQIGWVMEAERPTEATIAHLDAHGAEVLPEEDPDPVDEDDSLPSLLASTRRHRIIKEPLFAALAPLRHFYDPKKRVFVRAGRSRAPNKRCRVGSTIHKVVFALRDGPMDVDQLVAETGLTKPAVFTGLYNAEKFGVITRNRSTRPSIASISSGYIATFMANIRPEDPETSVISAEVLRHEGVVRFAWGAIGWTRERSVAHALWSYLLRDGPKTREQLPGGKSYHSLGRFRGTLFGATLVPSTAAGKVGRGVGAWANRWWAIKGAIPLWDEAAWGDPFLIVDSGDVRFSRSNDRNSIAKKAQYEEAQALAPTIPESLSALLVPPKHRR